MAMRLPADLNLGALLGWRKVVEQTAVVYEGRAISHATLDRDADLIARALLPLREDRSSQGPDFHRTDLSADRIAIISGNRPEFIAIMFGAMRAGFTVVPISPRQSTDVTCAVLREIDPVHVYVEDASRPALPATFSAVSIESLRLACGYERVSGSPGVADDVAAMSVGDDDLAEILYTSGSTGRPRGVPLTHRGQIWFLNTFLDATGWSPDVALVAAPLFHMNALIRVKCALATGGRVVLQQGFSPESYLGAIAAHRVTLLTGVPTMFAILLERRDLLRRTDTSSVTRLMLGSGAAPPDLVEALQREFPNAKIGVAYGLTEAGGTVSSTLISSDGAEVPTGSVGRPLPGIELRFDEGDARQGVLHLRSPAMATSYFQRPEQSAQRFRDGWLKSDDVLHRDEEGWLYFRGRADDMFVCGGENVYPAQVEAGLLSHPQVAQAVVVPVPDRIRGQVAFAFVVLHEGSGVTDVEVQAHVARNAPSHLHAYHIHLLNAMPLSGTNKVDLAGLRQRALDLASQV